VKHITLVSSSLLHTCIAQCVQATGLRVLKQAAACMCYCTMQNTASRVRSKVLSQTRASNSPAAMVKELA
jgi:hypothetical protein